MSFRNSKLLVPLAALALALAPSMAEAKLDVLTSTSDLADAARAVGGDKVEVSSIATGVQDAHFIEAKPSFMVKARGADLFIHVGMELEMAWVPPVLEGSRNPKVQMGQPGNLDASAGVRKLEVPTGAVDRSMGDVHALGNPHYWLDPYNMRIVGSNIAQRLSELSPGDAAYFQSQLAAFTQRIDESMFGKPLVAALGSEELWKLELTGDFPAALASLKTKKALPELGGWAGQLASFHGAHVMTYHRSWSYLIDRFGLVSTGEIEPKPGVPPTPTHVLELIQKAKAESAGAILVEPYYSDQAANLIAKQTGAKVLRVPLSVAGDAQSGDWFALMDHVVGSLAEAFNAKAHAG